jgi:hypothetical protein
MFTNVCGSVASTQVIAVGFFEVARAVALYELSQ